VSEQQIQQRIRLALSRGPVRLYRNNTGTLRDANGRPVTFGLEVGSADLIGWTTRTITPDMVGQQVAEQRQWLEAVQAAGGIAGIARSVEDAARLTGDAQGV
jgi:hypothetical protein